MEQNSLQKMKKTFVFGVGSLHFCHSCNMLFSHYNFTSIQYNTIQYNTIQYNTIQYNTIQYNTIQYNFISLLDRNIHK
jgi:hypothetical protein